jgi:hypothetical protein
MVETHEVQHRRMDIVDMDAVFDGPVAEFVSRSRTTPPLMPPPASHTVKP